MGMVEPPKCRLCGTTEGLGYCGMCKKYFCDRCRHRYPKRVEEMMKEKGGDLIDGVMGFLGLR